MRGAETRLEESYRDERRSEENRDEYGIGGEKREEERKGNESIV